MTTGRTFEIIHSIAKKQAKLYNFDSAYKAYNLLKLLDPTNEQIQLEFNLVILKCYFLVKEEDAILKLSQMIPKSYKQDTTSLSAGEQYLKQKGIDISMSLASDNVRDPKLLAWYISIQSRMQKGIEKFHHDDYIGCLEEFNKAVAFDANQGTLIPRAMVYLNMGELIRAKEDFERALLCDLYRLIHINTVRSIAHKIASAEAKKIQVEKLDPSIKTYQDLLPIALKQLSEKNYNASIKTLTIAMEFEELESNFHIIYSKRGYANLQLKHYTSALYDYAVSIWLNHPFLLDKPSYSPIEDFVNLRKVCIGLGNLIAAKNAQGYIEFLINTVKTINKETQEFYSRKSLEEHNKDFSCELLDSALEKLAEEQITIARLCLELAIKVWPKNTNAIIELSTLLIKNNNPKQAMALLKAAEKVDPKNERLIIYINNLRNQKKAEYKAIESESKSSKQHKKGKKQKAKERQQQAKKRLQPSTVMRDFIEEKEKNSEAVLKQIIHEIEAERAHKKTLKTAAKKKAREKKTRETSAEPKKDQLFEHKEIPKPLEEKKAEPSQSKIEEEKARYDRYMKKVAMEKEIMEQTFAKLNAARLAKATGSTQIQVKLNQIEQDCLEALDSLGATSYLVGSKVIDHLQNKPFNIYSDIDIVTTASDEVIRKAFPNVYPNPYDSNSYTAIVNGVKVDIRRSNKLKKSLLADANERDFTMDAIFADKNGKIFDPTGRGIKDLFDKNGPVLNTILDPINCFARDPIRLLRALYKIIIGRAKVTEDLMKTIQDLLPSLVKVNPGILHTWLLKILIHNPDKSFKTLLDLKIFDLLFPHIADIIKKDQKWILAELQILEYREMAYALYKFKNETSLQLKKLRKPCPNDLYTIFMISAVKNMVSYQAAKNPLSAVISGNRILESYFDRFSQDPRIIKPMEKRWNQAHKEVNAVEFTLDAITIPPAKADMYTFNRSQVQAVAPDPLLSLFGSAKQQSASAMEHKRGLSLKR